MSLLGQKKKAEDYVGINSIIGEDTHVKGEITSKGSVRIAGHFEGTITAHGDVVVSEGSKIQGNISAARILVSGDVNGNIIANGGLEVTKTGKVFGDITCDKIIVDEGAVYKGKVNLEMPGKKE